MTITIRKYAPLSFVVAILFLHACSSDTDQDDEESSSSTDTSTSTETSVDVDPFNFDTDATVDTITIESCTLSDGSETSCYRIDIAGAPSNYEVGVFCPEDIYASADEGGIWFDGSGEVEDIDGDFIANLATYYDDDNWLLYDPDTGLVNVTDTYEKCVGAARPNVDADLQNHCVECSMEYVDGGISQSFLIPVTPTMASSTTSVSDDDVGITLNGVILAPPAPVEAILSNYTIAAFDDCAGHINPIDGYHYHGAANCSYSIEQSDSHAPLFAYAMDGYGIYEMLDEDGNEETDLDECRGHSDDTRGYHYHAASVGENMFIGCFSGLTAEQ
jgi:hypothetical protein